jgi:NADH dehydrogenase/NADH:ubiquinone oxidoreductase subunit G
MAKVQLTIDGKTVTAEEGAMLLQVAREAGADIPTLCHNDEVKPYGACRMCMVEVEEKGRKKLVTSCTFPVKDGISVTTHSDRLYRNRKMIVELLLARCYKVPEVRDLAREYGIDVEHPRFQVREDTCILCGLCVRVCDEVVGVHAIGFAGRGPDRVPTPPFKEPSQFCIACGACVYVCPVDAIKMVQTPETRTIKRWQRTLPMKTCRVCGEPFMPEYQADYFMKRAKNIPEDFFEVCPNCR